MTEPKGDSAVTRDDAGDCGGREVDRFVEEAPVRSPSPAGDLGFLEKNASKL